MTDKIAASDVKTSFNNVSPLLYICIKLSLLPRMKHVGVGVRGH